MFYVCTLEVSAPGGSENLGVHQQHSEMCEPESNLTRRVSNKTFWIAILPQNNWLHFHKVMHRETLGLFKSFKDLPANRGLNLSHFGFFSARFPISLPEMVRYQITLAPTLPLSSLRLFSLHVIR